MDDFLNDINTPAPRTPLAEAWHNEQRRKAYDIIRVSNPAQVTVKGIIYQTPVADFYIEYDTNQYQKIPGNSTRDIPRFRAERYVEHKKDEIVNFVNQKLHDEFLADRDRRGLPRYVDKASENKETYETQQYPKTNDAVVVAEIYDQLWIGLVNRAGNDRPPVAIDPHAGEVDLTPISQKILETMASKRVMDEDTQPVIPQAPIIPQVSPFANLNQKLTVEDITNE